MNHQLLLIPLGTLLLLLLVNTSSSSSIEPNAIAGSNESDQYRSYDDSIEVDTQLPECFSNFECGQDELKLTCIRKYIVEQFTTYTCLDPGRLNATCKKEIKNEYLNMCYEDERCVEGKKHCYPLESCSDGIKNQEEKGVDCGGPCKTCPTCGNGIRDGNEEDIDCGGSCHDCTIECTSDKSCGISHWSPSTCGKDNNVYSDYVTYECRRPGEYSSRCEINTRSNMVKYCGPINICFEGECIDPRHHAIDNWDGIKTEPLMPGSVITVETWYGQKDVRVYDKNSD